MKSAGWAWRASLTALAVATVFLGGVAEFVLFDGSVFFHDYAGLKGVWLGYLAGLALVAWSWPAPTRSPGSRLFAYCAWGALGLMPMPYVLIASARAFEPINRRLWPMPPMTPAQRAWQEQYGERFRQVRRAMQDPIEDVSTANRLSAELRAIPIEPDTHVQGEWEDRSIIRTRWGGAAGAAALGAFFLVAASCLGPAPLARLRPALDDAFASEEEAAARVGKGVFPRWGVASLGLGLLTPAVNGFLILLSINPLRKSFFPVIGSLVCVIAYLFGIAAALIALRRGERRPILASLGFALNACALYALYWLWADW